MYSAIEEAKADIVGLWALHFLVDKVQSDTLILTGLMSLYRCNCSMNKLGLVSYLIIQSNIRVFWTLMHGYKLPFFLIDRRYLLEYAMTLQGLLPKKLEETMYVSFLAGCFRSIRFGLEEAHGYD